MILRELRQQGWRSAALQRFALPLLSPLFLNGQQLSSRRGLYLELAHQDGSVSRGEIAPLPGFSRESLSEAEQQVRGLLRGQETGQPLYPSVAFGLDCARQAIASQSRLQPDYPLLHLDALPEAKHLAQLKLAKVKVARAEPELEAKRLQQLLLAHPQLRLRLDANRGWTYSQAKQVLSKLNTAQIDYLEEPLQDPQSLPLLAEATGVSLVLDESTQSPDFELQPFNGLKALVLKPSLIGSLARLEGMINQAHDAGLICVLSSAYESPWGLGQIATLANRLTPQQAPGVDTGKVFAEQTAVCELVEDFSF